MNRMHTECLNDRQEQRCEDHDSRCNVHECTGNQKDYVHDQKNNDLIICNTKKNISDCLRNHCERHNPSEDVGNTDQEYDHTRCLSRIYYDIPERFPCDASVADGNNQRIYYTDSRTFCSSENTSDDATDNYNDQ